MRTNAGVHRARRHTSARTSRQSSSHCSGPMVCSRWLRSWPTDTGYRSAMDTIAEGQVSVGRATNIPLVTAKRWVADYTDAAANRVSDDPYAFPAYDRYDGGTVDPGTLTDGDLLAPVLLNVQVKIRSFYGLQ